MGRARRAAAKPLSHAAGVCVAKSSEGVAILGSFQGFTGARNAVWELTEWNLGILVGRFQIFGTPITLVLAEENPE